MTSMTMTVQEDEAIAFPQDVVTVTAVATWNSANAVIRLYHDGSLAVELTHRDAPAGDDKLSVYLPHALTQQLLGHMRVAWAKGNGGT